MQSLNPLKRVNSILTGMSDADVCNELGMVSIPSSGSIQFLQILKLKNPQADRALSLNPLKRVNSILTK